MSPAQDFTPEMWAAAARIALASAQVYADDLVALRLAEHLGGNTYRLTARGQRVLRALGRLPLLSADEGAAA